MHQYICIGRVHIIIMFGIHSHLYPPKEREAGRNKKNEMKMKIKGELRGQVEESEKDKEKEK